MAEAASRDLEVRYRQLDAAMVRAQREFFAARGRYKTNGPARLSFIRGLQGEVDKTTRAAVDLYRQETPRLFEEAARNAYQGFQMTDTDRKQLNRLQTEGAKIIKGISDYTKRDVQRFINVDSDAYKVSAEDADKFITRNGIKGARFTAGGNHVTGARQTIGNYSAMAFRSNLARIHNLGFLSGARQGNISVVEVSDGPDCGWSFHRDSDKANGKIVSIQEAEAHPLAHPHCQRRFTVRPGLTEGDKSPRLSNAQKAAVATAAAASGLAVLGLAANMQSGRVMTVLRQMARAHPHWKRYDTGLKNIKDEIDHLTDVQPGQLYDFVSGLPIVETPEQLADYFRQARQQLDKMRKASVDELADIISAWGDAATYGDVTKIPLFIRDFLDIPEGASRKVVGDHFRDFTEFKNVRFAYRNMALGQTIIDFIDLETRARDKFFDWIGRSGPRFARLTFPKVGGQRYSRLSSVDPTGFVKGTRTAGRHGLINRLTFNANGALRAGFVRDPKTGRITPNFRLIPKGPIRIQTVVNRSKKDGKVLSVSAIMHLITKGAVNYEARFNLSLRALNIYKWEDILKLSAGDFRRLRMDPNFFNFVSTAAQVRIRGPRLGLGRYVTSFDFAHIFRVKWEDAKSIYELSSLYLREQLTAVRRWAVSGIGDVDWAMFGINAVDIPLDESERTIWVKDIINRILRALGLREEP